MTMKDEDFHAIGRFMGEVERAIKNIAISAAIIAVSMAVIASKFLF